MKKTIKSVEFNTSKMIASPETSRNNTAGLDYKQNKINKFDVELARVQTISHMYQTILDTLSHERKTIELKKNEFIVEFNLCIKNELVQNKTDEIIALNKSIGIDIAIEQAKSMAMKALNISTLSIPVPVQRTRLTVNGNDTFGLVISTLNEFNGIGFKTLPEHVKAQFGKTDIDRYSKLKPFYHTMRNGQGSGTFAQLVNGLGRDNVTIESIMNLKTGVDVNGIKLSCSDNSSLDYMKRALIFK